jgi:hypothetical protein
VDMVDGVWTLAGTAEVGVFDIPARDPRATAGRSSRERGGVASSDTAQLQRASRATPARARRRVLNSTGPGVGVGSDTANSTRKRAGWFARFPVTSLLLIQYGALALWPAWQHSDDHKAFITGIVVGGCGAAFVGEFVMARVHTGGRTVAQRSIVTPRAARNVTIVGFIGLYGSALFGARTYATQVGITGASPAARALTPLAPWALIGTAFTLYCYAAGLIDRGPALRRVLVACTGYLSYVLIIGITAPLGQFGLAVAAGALIVGLVRPRNLVAVLLLSFMLWPTLFHLRNEARTALVGPAPHGQSVSATQRLREDVFLDVAADYPARMGIRATSALDVVHAGLVPSVIDPFPRPALSTSRQISVATGSVSTNSVTFTFFGNLRAVSGTLAVLLVPMLLGLTVSRLAISVTPLRLTLLMAMVQGVLWIESMYPDGFAGVLQTLVSGAIALGVLSASRSVSGYMSANKRPPIRPSTVSR